jgi:hypothetical protein
MERNYKIHYFGPVKFNMRIDQHSTELEGQQLSIMV